MSGEAAFTRSWLVGCRTVTLTTPVRLLPGACLSAAMEWAPSTPERLTSAEWVQYRAGRNAAVCELAAALGVKVAVVDL